MVWNFVWIVVLIALSAFFSGTEMGYSSLNELRLRRAADNGGKREKMAHWIHAHYDDALNTLLIGNNLVNTATSSLATVIVITLLGNGYAWLATLATTILVLIFGEILPKTLAKSAPETVAIASAPILRGLMWVLKPIVFVVQLLVRGISKLWKGKNITRTGVTEDDLEVLFDTAEDEGSIDSNTTELLQSALDFDDVMAYEIVTPRVDMLAVSIDDPISKVISTAIDAPYSRLPVYEESKDNIIGILHVPRFLKHVIDDPNPDLQSMLMPACYVPHTAVLPAVLSTMRQQHCHMVVVADEFGGTLGILTMEDVLEELVGDIWDETDEINAEFALLPDGRYEASGDMRIADLLDTLDIDDRDFPYESTTLGGWASEMLGTSPKLDSSFTYKNLCISVAKLHKRRVTKVMISVVEPVPPETVEAS